MRKISTLFGFTLFFLGSCLPKHYESNAQSQNTPASAKTMEGLTSQEHSMKDSLSVSPWSSPIDSPDLTKDYRRTYTQITGFEKSGLHWGQFVRIYMNKGSQRYIANFQEYLRVYVHGEEMEGDSVHFQPYAPGTIFLKEHFSNLNDKPDQPLMMIAMIKHGPGYDSLGGDWEYLAWTTQGQWIVKGSSANPAVKTMCSSCHLNMAERDYIFSTYCSLVGSSD